MGLYLLFAGVLGGLFFLLSLPHCTHETRKQSVSVKHTHTHTLRYTYTHTPGLLSDDEDEVNE